MDGEWEDVKSKKKVQKKPQQQQMAGSSYGGMTTKGTLVAGPVQQTPSQGKYGGGLWKPTHEVVNHASTVADYDFGVDEEQREIKFETYSHVCSSAVSNARMDAKLTQAQLATKVNEKTATIVELENGSGKYDASLINRIEQQLKVQIPRGRTGGNKKKGKK